METVCGNVVKRIELEKRLNLLKVGFGHMTHICCMRCANGWRLRELLGISEYVINRLKHVNIIKNYDRNMILT